MNPILQVDFTAPAPLRKKPDGNTRAEAITSIVGPVTITKTYGSTAVTPGASSTRPLTRPLLKRSAKSAATSSCQNSASRKTLTPSGRKFSPLPISWTNTRAPAFPRSGTSLPSDPSASSPNSAATLPISKSF
jgi:hypothetical protein